MKTIILLLCVYFTFGQDRWHNGGDWQDQTSTVNIYQGYPIHNMTANFKLMMDKLDHLQELIENCACKENINYPSDFTQVGCATSSPVEFSPGVINLDGSQAGSWPANGFCRVYAKKDMGEMNYTISVDLLNVKFRGGAQSGHLGVFYNAKDINNFDFVYLRQHSASSCYQTGQVINGQLNWTGAQAGSCANGVPPATTWYNMKVVVKNDAADIYRDDVKILNVVSHFPARASGGTLVANGYSNLGRFRNFKITS